MSLKSFLTKLVPEYRAIASAVKVIAGGIALDPRDQEHVNDVVTKFENAADSIQTSIKGIAEASMSKTEVTALVKSLVKPEALK